MLCEIERDLEPLNRKPLPCKLNNNRITTTLEMQHNSYSLKSNVSVCNNTGQDTKSKNKRLTKKCQKTSIFNDLLALQLDRLAP